MKLSSFEKYVFVGLGSNLDSDFGSPKDNVLEAIERISFLVMSRFYFQLCLKVSLWIVHQILQSLLMRF